MQNKLNPIFWLAMLLFANTGFADNDLLIRQLQEKYQNISHYQASFTQHKSVSYISKPLVTKGSLEFALGVGLIWQVDEPLWVKTLITDQGVYKTTKYQSQQKVNDMQIKLVSEIMTELLTANLDKIESQFEVATVNLVEENSSWEVQLLPKKLLMKKTLKQISLIGASSVNTYQETILDGINQILIIDKSDNQTQILLDSIKVSNAQLSEEIRARFE
jgi:outer membrane lipoprotein-sorting protein